MNENNTSFNVCETILSKKLDNYYSENNDFVASGEITVEITLAEYRDLVASKARKDYELEKIRNEKYELDKKNTELKKEIKMLEDKVYKFVHYGDVRCVNNELDECEEE